jgi:hypothetical protein
MPIIKMTDEETSKLVRPGGIADALGRQVFRTALIARIQELIAHR